MLGDGIQVFSKQPGIGEAEIVSLAEDNVVEHADGEDFRGRLAGCRAAQVMSGEISDTYT